MQIEEALRENEEKYRLIIENQTDLIDQVDLEGTEQFNLPALLIVECLGKQKRSF